MSLAAPPSRDREPSAPDPARLPLADLRAKLDAPSDGLTSNEARGRLERFGPNALPERRTNPVLTFLSYFWGPIPWMIEAAVVLSAAVGHWADFWIILVLLVMNAGIGFREEHQAANAIAALKARLALRARVKRDGAWSAVPAADLVPGDLIRLRLGDIVPADARLLDDGPIEADQSALTGESLPVNRVAGDAVYSGSVVRRGESDALVYGTGRDTFFGRTAGLVAAAHTVSHFQRAVLKIGRYLIAAALVLVPVIVATALLRGDPPAETLAFALVLTVAAIPVAMPTVLSVTMAVGARTLARRQAIVSRLVSIEELAGVDVLCSDKTGTLTENRLTLGPPFAAAGVSPEEVVRAAALASRAEDGDPIDLAVLGGVPAGGTGGGRVTRFLPFDPVHKRTEADVTGPDGGRFSVAKGAPQVILALADAARDAAQGDAAHDDAVRPAAERAVGEFAARGFRSLGVARRDGDGPWRFLGVIPLFDPPRDDSKATIEAANRLGVAVKMVTGDQVAIGREVARQVGLGTNILDAGLFDGAESGPGGEDARVADAIEAADGFAQVFPEHKYRIVEALQRRGHIVAMTGDGVNDAPALKKADCGVAVAGATDAARAAADIVLTAPGLSVIVDAVRESRKIFRRMTGYAVYRIAETIRVLLFMTLSILVFNFYPVTAVMIVLLALLNDGAILSIAYDRVRPSDRPERWDMRPVLGLATALGLTGVAASFGLFYLGERVFHLSRDVIQSLIYLKLSVAGHLTIFVTRTSGPFWSIRPARPLLAAVVGTQAVATLIAVYGVFMPPVGWRWALLVWAYSLTWFLVNDRVKLVALRVLVPRRPR